MRVVAIGPLYNEGERVLQVVQRFPRSLVEEIVIVDDASTDGTGEKAARSGATVLTLSKRSGPGSAIREGIDYGLKKGYDVFVVFAANGKDNPEEISRLLKPIQENRADFVQGSRYLKGGVSRNMPLHRVWGIPLFSFLFSLAVRRRITDGTNGFRAFRRNVVEDPCINLWQEWLDGYPLERYLFLQAIRLGYRVIEVPVTKIYPKSKTNYTKQKPWIDWWNCFKPIPYVTFGLKK